MAKIMAEFLWFVLLVFVATFVFFIVWYELIGPFMHEYRRIKMEMSRSYSENEYRYWKRQLKKLYLHSIPIVWRFFK